MKMKKLAIAVAISALLVAAAAQTAATPPAASPTAAASASPATPQGQMPAECAPWVQAAKPPAVTALKDVKRIFVDSFGEDPVAQQIQAMVVAELMKSDKFVVTENRAKADAFLKGTGLEKTSTESHSYETGTAAGGFAGSRVGDVGSIGGSAAAIHDANSSTVTVNDARASVRLVNQEGDVLWATAQESKGAKYKGASADVADKIVKQLMRDIEKIEKKVEAANNSPAANK